MVLYCHFVIGQMADENTTHYPWTTHIIHEPQTLSMNHRHYPWTMHIIHEPHTLSMNHTHYPWTTHIIHEQRTLSMSHTHFPWTTHIIHEQRTLSMSSIICRMSWSCRRSSPCLKMVTYWPPCAVRKVRRQGISLLWKNTQSVWVTTATHSINRWMTEHTTHNQSE